MLQLRHFVFGFPGAVLLGCFSLIAQSPDGAIVGLVRDSSGGSVGEAAIKVRNMDTNGLRQLTSDREGRFAVPNLAPGRYEVTTEKPGFQTLRQSGVELEINQTVRLELTLKVGSLAESIEVSARAPLVNTENPVKGDVMVSKEIVELPLNGRNFSDLAFLVPGVDQTGEGDTGSPFAMGGARPDNTNYFIDGVSARRPDYGQTELSPNLDAIQEFKVSTSSYSAEFGQVSGGVISVALKSGSNQPHGALFEFLRNDKLDARNFFSASQPELRRNQFGAFLSGPVLLPKVYNGHDRTFFMFSWESYRDATGTTSVTMVPTALQRAGDFSQTVEAGGQRAQIKNPFGGGYFPGNIIPESLINPVAAKIMPNWPVPNRPGQLNNYLANVSSHSPWNSFITRIDQRISSQDSIAFRYQYNRKNSETPFDGGPLGTFGSVNNSTTQMIGLNHVRVFTPSVINEARAGLYRSNGAIVPMDAGTDYAALWGIAGISSSDPFLQGTPQVTVTGYATLGDQYQRPWVQTSNNYTFSDTLTWVKNAHEVKFGGSLFRNQYFQPYYNYIRGSFTFNGYWTTDPLADFLVGVPNNVQSQKQAPQNYTFSTYYGLFAQDDYKVSSRLTLNLGLRWDVNMPTHDKYGRWVGFIPEFGKLVAANPGIVPNFDQLIASAGASNLVASAQDLGVPQALVYTRYANMAPRFGLAWRPFGGTRTVVRGGYGVFWGASMNRPLIANLGTNYPFSVSQQVSRVPGNPNAINFANPFANATNAASLSIYGVQLRAPTPYMQSWNLTVERQLGDSMAIEVSYSGSKGTHLGLATDINRPYYSAQYRLPDGSFLRPYPQYNNSISFFSFGGNSTYNAGTATLRRRFARGSFFSANYTYSKSIDEGSTFSGGGQGGPHQVQDPRNLRLERGRSNFSPGHTFTMSYSYPIPWRGTPRLGWMLRGWQLAGSGQARTGQPFTPAVSGVNLAVGGAVHPDRIRTGALPDPSVEKWFDVAAFPLVPNGQYRMGTSGRNILDGPGMMAVNFSLSRNMRVRERQQVQFRWEVFNATNHPNFGLPIATMNTITAGTITSAGSPRQMQVGLRYQF
jgi:hypothetical protein